MSFISDDARLSTLSERNIMIEERYLPSRVMVAVFASIATLVIVLVVIAIYDFMNSVQVYNMGVEDTCAQFNYTLEACPVDNLK